MSEIEIERVVLVADGSDYDFNHMDIYDRNLDRPHVDYVRQLEDAIVQSGYQLVSYNELQPFIDNIRSHKEDLVLPYWSGQDSRNRHGLLPAVCESAGIRYIGGDAFTKTVSNDKQLTKLLCRDLGMSAPDSFVLLSDADVALLDDFPLPYILKPMHEGTSMGISERNLITDRFSGRGIALELLREFNAPVIAEAFVTGKEVSICILGYGNQIRLWAAAERIVADDPDYFINRVYNYKDKSERNNLEFRSVKHILPAGLMDKCFRLFEYLDKVEYLRIDGRLNDTGFHLIELTPESHLGHDAEFCGPILLETGLSYQQLIKEMIDNSIARYRSRNTNRSRELDMFGI